MLSNGLTVRSDVTGVCAIQSMVFMFHHEKHNNNSSASDLSIKNRTVSLIPFSLFATQCMAWSGTAPKGVQIINKLITNITKKINFWLNDARIENISMYLHFLAGNLQFFLKNLVVQCIKYRLLYRRNCAI